MSKHLNVLKKIKRKFNKLFTFSGTQITLTRAMFAFLKTVAFHMEFSQKIYCIWFVSFAQPQDSDDTSKQTNKCSTKLVFHMRVKMIDGIVLHTQRHTHRKTCMRGISHSSTYAKHVVIHPQRIFSACNKFLRICLHIISQIICDCVELRLTGSIYHGNAKVDFKHVK